MTDPVAISADGPILTLRFARPEKKNAITAAMYQAMAEALTGAQSGGTIRVIVFLGSGGNFTAGNDLGDFLDNPPQDESAPVFRFLSALADCTLPIVAGVDGTAVGIGTTLLLHCDLVFITPGASLRLPFVNLGLVPEAGSSHLLPRLLGHARAAELVMLGEAFSGARAHELGIANRLTEAGRLDGEVMAAARALAAKPPAALRATKALLKGNGGAVKAAMAAEAEQFKRRLVSAEAREAFRAFLEKREADFSRPSG